MSDIGQQAAAASDEEYGHIFPGRRVVAVEKESMGGKGGLNALMERWTVRFDDDSIEAVVSKSMPSEGGFRDRSKTFGHPRECHFYATLRQRFVDLGVNIPEVLYAHGDMETGEKTLILRDLSVDSVQAGYFFGPGSPHNTGKDLEALTACARLTGSDGGGEIPYAEFLETVALEATKQAACIHALYWRDDSLFRIYSWLRGSDWLKGENMEAWAAAQKVASDGWLAVKAQISDSTSTNTTVWPPLLVECIDSSISKISWSDFVASQREQQWTLTHGDFHPANLLWKITGSGQGQIYVIDWEQVGLGSGPQDLAQCWISHMNPVTRRQNEQTLLRTYYTTLVSVNPQIGVSYTYENCLADYVSGGTSRWVWLVIILATMCPDEMMQFFIDQLFAFIVDHGVTPATIEMPRV
jgi:Phosphotransferase enzyme family